MTDRWDVVVGDDLDDRSVAGASAVIRASFPPGHPPTVSPEYYRWKLGDANPAGRGYLSVAVADGVVVGSMAVTRKRYRFRGRDLAGAEVGDVFTAPEFLRAGGAAEPWEGDPEHYLSKSVFGRLSTETMLRSDRDGVELYFGVANEAAIGGWIKRLGFAAWTGAPLTTYSRPGAALVARRAARAHVPRRPIVVADAVHARLQGVLAGRRAGDVREIGIDDELAPFDELWTDVRDRVPLQPVRDARYIRHRFHEHPLASYRVFLVERGSRPVGYYVTRTHVDTSGRRVAMLADVSASGDHTAALTSAFAETVARESDPDIELYSTWTQRPWPRRHRIAVAAPRTFESGLILRCRPGHPLELPDSMELTCASSDNV